MFLEREELAALDGRWGDPTVGEPIQTDIIDVETPTHTFTVEVYNRATS
jgi:hypothetical protein